MSKSEFSVGDLMWAKIGSYPYWPCIISTSPGTQNFQKPAKKGSLVHVHFFGDNGKHSWVSSSALMEFKGLEEFNKLKFKSGDTTKPQPGFNVKSNLKAPWDEAVKEIESVQKKDVSKRLDAYYGMSPLKMSSSSGGSSKRKSVSSDEDVPAAKVVKSAPPKKAIKAAAVAESLQNGDVEEKKESKSSKEPEDSQPEQPVPAPVKSKKEPKSKKGPAAAPATAVAPAPEVQPDPAEDSEDDKEPSIDLKLIANKFHEILTAVISNKKQLSLAKSLISKITELAVHNELTDKTDVK
uniref:Probable histone-lysine N-methyltransferase Mes-4 n=1 Tax=Cacopsylla melanoneura TaxID=428564 RepID=A0A8D8S3R8_9HEMI